MSVVDYELYTIPPRWHVLKIETDDGQVGWGEPYLRWHTLDDSTPATAAAVDQMMTKYVLGEDPAPIADRWEAMYTASFFRGGPVHAAAVAGIDQALWDLKGRRYGAPVYDLLGGPTRERVRAYCHLPGETPEEKAAAAETAVSDGFTAMKTSFGGLLGPMDAVERPAATDAAGEMMAAIRDAVGPEIDVAVDFHGNVSTPLARRCIAALEPYDPLFVEEPVTPEYEESLPALREATTVPIATGERMYTRMDFKSTLAAGGVDVVQPDVSGSFGITECRRIAELADAYDASFAPHTPIGPLCLAASLHVDAAVPNTLVQEQTLLRADDWRDYVVGDPFAFADGCLELPSGPGLGVEPDESTLRERDGETGDWDRGIPRLPDGSVTGR